VGVKETAAESFGQLLIKVGNAGKANGLTLGDAVRTMLEDGMSPANVEATLLADLDAGGRRFFGPMFKGLRETALGGIDRAMDAMEMVAYDDRLKAASQSLVNASVKGASKALDGATKADLSTPGPESLETWITVMDDKVCPDCSPRHGVTQTRVEWAQVGRPRWGTTICGPHCRCKLIPAAAAVADGEIRDDLKESIRVPRRAK
jgi:hypothetical protein